MESCLGIRRSLGLSRLQDFNGFVKLLLVELPLAYMLDLYGLVAVALHFGAYCWISPATRRSPPTFTTRHNKGARMRFPTLATRVPALAIVHFVRRRGAAYSG